MIARAVFRIVASALLVAAASTQAAAQERTMYANAYIVNIRQYPSLDAKIVGTMPCGKSVVVDAITTNGWYRLKSPTQGFVFNKLLSDTPKCDTPDTPYVLKTTKQRAFLRTLPDTKHGRIVAILDAGQTITVTARTTNGWYQVYYKGTPLFIAEFLVE